MFGKGRAFFDLRRARVACKTFTAHFERAWIVAPAILVVGGRRRRASRPRTGNGLGYALTDPASTAPARPPGGLAIGLSRLRLTEAGMFALAVRFDLLPGKGQEFDRLVNETLSGITASEPGTLLYLCHQVADTPDARVFYELYRDHAAFEEHERQPHVRRFLADREAFLVRPPRVDRLSSLAGKGIELD